ncbi:MAG: hypothetical protein WDW36_000143 [Sanguina aurantia]
MQRSQDQLFARGRCCADGAECASTQHAWSAARRHTCAAPVRAARERPPSFIFSSVWTGRRRTHRAKGSARPRRRVGGVRVDPVQGPTRSSHSVAAPRTRPHSYRMLSLRLQLTGCFGGLRAGTHDREAGATTRPDTWGEAGHALPAVVWTQLSPKPKPEVGQPADAEGGQPGVPADGLGPATQDPTHRASPLGHGSWVMPRVEASGKRTRGEATTWASRRG